MKKLVLICLLTMVSLNAKSIAVCSGDASGDFGALSPVGATYGQCYINGSDKPTHTSIYGMYKKGWRLIVVTSSSGNDKYFYFEK